MGHTEVGNWHIGNRDPPSSDPWFDALHVSSNFNILVDRRDHRKFSNQDSFRLIASLTSVWGIRSIGGASSTAAPEWEEVLRETEENFGRLSHIR